jgi:hypothetical protein
MDMGRRKLGWSTRVPVTTTGSRLGVSANVATVRELCCAGDWAEEKPEAKTRVIRLATRQPSGMGIFNGFRF